MSRSNYDKPFYVDVGTSIVAVRCASNHDVVFRYDHALHPSSIELAEAACDRMNNEAEIGRSRRNCDAGTAEEQIERWQAFCNRYDNDCTGCPCDAADTWNYTHCFAKWAQMPYVEREGGAK